MWCDYNLKNWLARTIYLWLPWLYSIILLDIMSSYSYPSYTVMSPVGARHPAGARRVWVWVWNFTHGCGNGWMYVNVVGAIMGGFCSTRTRPDPLQSYWWIKWAGSLWSIPLVFRLFLISFMFFSDAHHLTELGGVNRGFVYQKEVQNRKVEKNRSKITITLHNRGKITNLPIY
jgi:hypothetical protein